MSTPHSPAHSPLQNPTHSTTHVKQGASDNNPKVAHDAPHGVGHVVPFKILMGVFLALTVLTVVTVLASLVDFGEFNLIVALAIAVLKASLVVLFFMHLVWDRPFNAIVFVGCLIFVALFIALALLDTRQYRGTQTPGQAPGVKESHKLLTPGGAH